MTKTPLLTRYLKYLWFLVAFFLTVELGSWLIFTLSLAPPFDPYSFGNFTRSAGLEVTHPYLGQLASPKAARHLISRQIIRTDPSGTWQFFNESLPATENRNAFILALSGNSVMEFIAASNEMRAEFSAKLKERIPYLKKHGLRFLNLSQFAFKQPQQAIATLLFQNYFDALVNLDGFNEVGPGIRSLAPSHYPLVYPRLTLKEEGVHFHLWNGSRVIYSHLGQSLSDHGLLHLHSVRLGVLVARSLLTYWAPEEQHVSEEALRDTDGQPQSYVTLWKDGVRSQWAILKAQGKPSWYFLQPNLHFDGSKKFTPKEEMFRREGAIPIARLNYPKLVTGVEELKKTGVQIWDLTGLYRNIQDEIYIDPCCHVNKEGAALLVDAMVEAIAKSWPPNYQPAHLNNR